tara:strand:+ start:66988 stop:67533 length:546 start_codon:yes stop_codon:yes gene_type:complete
MNDFFYILKKNYKNRYQKWLPNTKFLNKRALLLNKLLNSKTSKNIIVNKEKFKLNFIKTNNFLKNLTPNKMSIREKKIILSFYKKYNYSLKLKKIYNYKMLKKTNAETDFSSYIYLGNHILKLSNLTELQKLNCILKINDITLLNINSKNITNLIPNIKKNIKFEIKKTKKYAKKSFNNFR